MYKLALNLGSSSLKFKLFDKNLKVKVSGLCEKIGQNDSFFVFKKGRGEIKLELLIKDHQQALQVALEILQTYKFDLRKIEKVGHRVVHGGEEFDRPTLITNNNIRKLEKYNKLAPLHNPYNLLGIKFCLKNLKQAKNYAVFDTAFYSKLPDYAFTYAIPSKYNIRKFGFHGISHEYVANQAAIKLKKPLKQLNLITCHLGSGCSITAIKKGKAVDTSMGFTPLAGVMMSTRSGDLDPAVVLKMVEKEKSLKKVEEILNFKSGWFGLTGLKDMRDILVAAGHKVMNYKFVQGQITSEQKKCSKLALQMFIYQVRKYIGAYSAVLGKVDAVIYTAGIGERNALIRKMIMKDIKLKSLAINTDEELAMAKKI